MTHDNRIIFFNIGCFCQINMNVANSMLNLYIFPFININRCTLFTKPFCLINCGEVTSCSEATIDNGLNLKTKYRIINITKKINNIIIVYLLDNKVNAINNAQSKMLIALLLCENKGSLHTLKYSLKVKRESQFFEKYIIKIGYNH